MSDWIEAGDDTPDLYVARNLSIEEFAKWASGSDPGAPRLRSVVGPPGCGKSTFLRALRDRLRGEGQRVLWLDLAPSSDKPLPDLLHDALDQHAQEAKIPFASDRSVLFAAAFDAFLRSVAKAEPRLTLIVDGFEDVAPDERAALEAQVLTPFLFPTARPEADRCAVIDRRDEYGLQEAQLRWEETVKMLKGLDPATAEGPVEQILRRLRTVVAASGDPITTATILEWKEEGSHLTDAQAKAFVEFVRRNPETLAGELAPYLTPNPYINLSLLRRILLRPKGALDTDDYDAVLKAYMRRARLPDTATLIDLVRRVDERGELRLSEYQAPGESAAALEAFIAAGILTNPYADRYRVDSGLHQLVLLLVASRAEGMPAATAAPP